MRVSSSCVPSSDATQARVGQEIRALLAQVLAIRPERADEYRAETPLFGALPGLDSLGFANLLTAIEDRFLIRIEEDELDQGVFATFGGLTDLVCAKIMDAGRRP